jgi:hypothetical protein
MERNYLWTGQGNLRFSIETLDFFYEGNNESFHRRKNTGLLLVRS